MTGEGEPSESWLRERGIPTNNWFASSENAPFDLRPATEVAERAMVLTVLAARALSNGEFSEEDVVGWLLGAGIADALTPSERAYLAQPKPTERQTIDASWRIESAWTLAWALGWAPELGPMQQGQREEWFFENVFTADTGRLRGDAKLRPEPQIHAAIDLIIRVHWAVRHAGLDGKPPPPDIDAGVVIERHWALNWLTDPETPWDEVTTDT